MTESIRWARTWVWWGLTPYRCDWTWNRQTDLLRLERAVSWWDRPSSTSRKRFRIEQKALRDQVDRARLMLALASRNTEYQTAADDLTQAQSAQQEGWVGLLAYVLLLAASCAGWKLLRSWGVAIPEEMLVLPAVLGPMVMGPAGNWFSRMRRTRN